MASLAETRRAIMRQLYRAGHSQSYVRAIINFLDWTMGVPDDIAAIIDEEVEAEEGEVAKRLKSRWEERVETAAIAQGRQDLVLRQLEHRFGPLGDVVRNRLSSLSGDQLIALAEALLDFTGRSDLDRWLSEHAPQ